MPRALGIFLTALLPFLLNGCSLLDEEQKTKGETVDHSQVPLLAKWEKLAGAGCHLQHKKSGDVLDFTQNVMASQLVLSDMKCANGLKADIRMHPMTTKSCGEAVDNLESTTRYEELCGSCEIRTAENHDVYVKRASATKGEAKVQCYSSLLSKAPKIVSFETKADSKPPCEVAKKDASTFALAIKNECDGREAVSAFFLSSTAVAGTNAK